MEYIIKNHKNLYIRLNENGKPVTCAESDKSTFEKLKAHNILDSLPKTLKRLKFRVECIPDVIVSPETCKPKTVITHTNYEPPDEVVRWLEKFGVCEEVINEDRIRKEELVLALSNVDKELSNELHKIELGKWENAYIGYIEYKTIKKILEKRRKIKDEHVIISNILSLNFSNFDGKIINEAIKNLIDRKFTLRVVDGI